MRTPALLALHPLRRYGFRLECCSVQCAWVAFAPPRGDCARAVIQLTIPAMHRRLVSGGLVDPDTLRIEASDGTFWLHHVERDRQGKPIPEQIDRWLSLLWAPTYKPQKEVTMNNAGYGNQQALLEQGAKTGSAADRAFYEAARQAKEGVKTYGLLPAEVAPGEFKYSVQQGLKAACFAREDAASILLIQPAILRRLDALKRLAWVAIGLLAYIAYRLS